MNSNSLPGPASRSHFKDVAIIFVLLALSYAYFIPTRNGNAIPRIALTASIIRTGSLSIDDYANAINIDKAYAEGHYYSDKAPGLSVMALPAVYGAEKLLGLDLSADAWTKAGQLTNTLTLVLYVATFSTCGIVTAASGACLFLIALRIFGSYGGALFAALAYGLGTPVWGWSTNFLGHALSGAWLILGVAATLSLLGSGSIRRGIGVGLIGGLFLGFSVVVEYTAAPAVALIFLIVGVEIMHKRRNPTAILAIGAGGLLTAVPLMLYNDFAFGSPFALGYSNVSGFEGMHEGLFGVTLPSLRVLFEITLGRYRGILWLSPILILAPLAIVALWRERRFRPFIAICASVVTYYLLLNASYYYWNGGDSLGPRHVTPMLGFAILPMAGLWTVAGKLGRAVMASLLGASVLISVACVATTGMIVSGGIRDPLFERVFPQFVAGDLPSVTKHLFGPTGLINLLPLLVVWMVGASILFRLHTTSKRPASTRPFRVSSKL